MHGVLSMSRVSERPVQLPDGVEVSIVPGAVSVKGKHGELNLNIHPLVTLQQENQQIKVASKHPTKEAEMFCGTFRSLIANMVRGVSQMFELRLLVTGVGYRAQLQGQKLSLSLGFSHPVIYELPKQVSGEVQDQTEIVLRSPDKQQIGQVAAEIRALRPPEPYKGKGIRYSDERVRLKETKKK